MIVKTEVKEKRTGDIFINYLHDSEDDVANILKMERFINYLHDSEAPITSYPISAIFINYLHDSEGVMRGLNLEDVFINYLHDSEVEKNSQFPVNIQINKKLSNSFFKILAEFKIFVKSQCENLNNYN